MNQIKLVSCVNTNSMEPVHKKYRKAVSRVISSSMVGSTTTGL